METTRIIPPQIPANKIDKIDKDSLGILAALHGKHATVGPSPDTYVTATEIAGRKTMLGNAQNALHTMFVALGLYKKGKDLPIRDGHFHPTDYSTMTRRTDVNTHCVLTHQALMDHIKRMDEVGVRMCLLMGIPLMQSNISLVGSADDESNSSANVTENGQDPPPPVEGASVDRNHHRLAPPEANVKRKGSVDSLEITVIEPSGGSRPSVYPASTSAKTPSPPESHRSFQHSDISSCCGNFDPTDRIHAEATYYLNDALIQDGRYPAQPNELYYYSAVDGLVANAYQRLSPSQKKRFGPMITGFNVTDDRAWVHMLNCMTAYKQTFVGAGEFTVHKEIVSNQVSGPTADLRHRGLYNVFQFAGQIGIFLTVHCDIEAMPRDAWLKEKQNPTAEERARIDAGEVERLQERQHYFDGLLRLCQAHPETEAVIAHGMGIGRFVDPREDHLALAREFLRNTQNKYFDISWDKLSAHINANPESRQGWADLLNEFPGRIIFGSDSMVPADAAAYAKTQREYQSLSVLLNPGVEEMVFSKNLKGITERAKLNRDSWERAGCPIFNPTVRGLNRPAPHETAQLNHGLDPTVPGLNPPSPTGSARVTRGLKHKIAALKDEADKRIRNKGKSYSLNGDPGTIKVKVRKVKEYQKLTLEQILEQLRAAFVDKYSEEELREFEFRLGAPRIPAVPQVFVSGSNLSSEPGAPSMNISPWTPTTLQAIDVSEAGGSGSGEDSGSEHLDAGAVAAAVAAAAAPEPQLQAEIEDLQTRIDTFARSGRIDDFRHIVDEIFAGPAGGPDLT